MSRFDQDGTPFTLVFDDAPQAAPLLDLLRAELPEFEAVMGPGLRFSATPPATHRWIVRPGSPASLTWTGSSRTLTSVADTADDFVRTLNLLHTLARSTANSLEAVPARDRDEAVARIRDEVAGSYPSFALRGLDWPAICARHDPAAAPDFANAAAEWVAELGDAHTAVRRAVPTFHPGYRGVLTTGGVEVMSVPDGSPAHDAGVGPGWVIEVDDPAGVLATTGASPRHRTQVAARRALAVLEGERRFHARRQLDGRTVTWLETARAATLGSTLRATRDPDGTRRVRLAAFDGSLDLAGAFDDLLAGGRPGDRLVLDLRGNPGGSLLAATVVRDRFLHRDTVLGSVRFSTGTGELAPARVLRAAPSSRVRWPGPLTVLADEMTYSAAEDFLLGLQGLDHVTVLGCATGGGSGRPRTVPLLDDLVLTVSTALTYDRTGRCIESHGIPVDGGLTG